jgi:electron transport complex protein RnfC
LKTTADVGGTTDRPRGFWATLARRFLRVPQLDLALNTGDESAIRVLDAPAQRRLCLGWRDGQKLLPAVRPDDDVTIGQPLARHGDRDTLPSPVAGKVVGIEAAPDIRGGEDATAVVIESNGTGKTPFAAMEASAASRAALLDRLRETGVQVASLDPRPLAELLESSDGEPVIILAADREPGVSTTAQLLRARHHDVARAAALVGQAASASSVRVAVPEALAPLLHPMDVHPLPATYPATLEPVVARRAGTPNATVVPLETALAALDAIETGTVQAHKLVTVIGFDSQPTGVFEVAIGTSISHLLAEIGIEVGDRDRVVVGGPLRGFAQYSLDAGVDAGVDAVVVMPAGALPPWSDAPCINCGACIDVCPANLQVHSIGRCCEFSLFDRVRELHIGACFECGLCAAACTAHRPLLQLIRLGKKQLASGKETGS